MKNKNLIFLALLIFLVGLVMFLLIKTPKQLKTDKKIKIVASFYPLAHFTSQIVADNAQIITLIPQQAEPHDYEPSTKEIQQVYNAQLFIYNGAGLDPWADKIADNLKNKKVKVIKMADHFSLLKSNQPEFSFDPHFWVDPHYALEEVKIIKQALVEIDPNNKETYVKNYLNYSKKLQELINQYEIGLKNCQTNKIVVSHNAFSYLAKRYNLFIQPIAGISPEQEPSTKELINIISFVKNNQLKYIFFETLVSPKLAQTIARETGAKTLVLNPAEDGIKGSYLEIMANNLTNLKIALNCQ
jgi:zinc transport system substrate-binding protein